MKNDPAVRAVIAAWRRLTTEAARRRAGPGAPLVIACSGGADSSALAIALSAAVAGSREAPRVVLGHVVHDLRPRREALADRDATRDLAARLGLEFREAAVRVRTGKSARLNAEGAARIARYRAMARMARDLGIAFVATAHHADDQLETVLMALLRGAGPRGLSGVAEVRRHEGVSIIRPLLAARIGRADAERICREFGWTWREDSTNTDESRLRAAVRRRVTPVLKAIRPRAADLACATASLMADLAGLVRSRAARLLALRVQDPASGAPRWERSRLRRVRPVVLGEMLRLAASEHGEGRGADRVGQRSLGPVVRAIRDDCTDPRRFMAGGIEVDVTARTVTIRKRRTG
ncbi:MAG: tRNA lysidine(34) synthetase TilS [Phycisphaeraceae bacterium]|nr:tRNA lysidine(34) synthetase TilS [Phycisphaeraceae bacterium]